MYSLGVSDHIMIAHSITGPMFGPAQQLHGATYTVDVQLRVPELGPHHVVMDIGRFRSALRSVLDGLDYHNLDQHPAFARHPSTTERVAEHIAQSLTKHLSSLDGSDRPPTDATLTVTVRESPVAYAGYECKLEWPREAPAPSAPRPATSSDHPKSVASISAR
jgi:6-pyruvoyl-tetrahydropterin synthase